MQCPKLLFNWGNLSNLSLTSCYPSPIFGRMRPVAHPVVNFTTPSVSSKRLSCGGFHLTFFRCFGSPFSFLKTKCCPLVCLCQNITAYASKGFPWIGKLDFQMCLFLLVRMVQRQKRNRILYLTRLVNTL